ncbi:protein mono-ADP-ribosyltransferase PARP14-like [Mya arenaria]|nr:protein mono-ADP-ribosyltransferase PARP14-like [Mya arenaria]
MKELWEKVTTKLSEISLEQPNAAAAYLAKDGGKTDTWEEKHSEMHLKYRDKLVFDTTYLGKLVIGTTDDIANEVEHAIQSFLRANSILKDIIKVPKNVYRLMKRHHESDVQRIASALYSGQVRIVSKDDAHAFEISGTKDGMEQAKTQVEALLTKVNKKQHEVRKPGLGEYMQTEKGSEITRAVESAFPCVISMNDGCDDIGSENIRVIASCTGYENRRMFAAVGDMSEINVDVIVNPSDDNIGLFGGLGKVLKIKGGLALERPCRDYIKNNGPLSEGEVFVSPAGNLKAKHIIHVVGPAWKDGTHQEVENLAEVVFKAMKQASMKNLKSLAMPAISCGVYGFPVKKATGIIVAAVKNFFRKEQDSSLTEIYLCDMNGGTVNAFTEALQKEWGAKNVEKHANKSQHRKPGMVSQTLMKKCGKPLLDEANSKSNCLKEIKRNADEHHVDYKLIGGDIQIFGVMQNVVKVTDDIYTSLRDAAKIEQEHNAAVILKDIVQWYWMEQTEMTDELKPYEMMMNYQIEQAFKTQEDKFTYTDNGETVIVDFKNYSEYCQSKPGEEDTILRKYIIKEFSGEVPANWRPMKGNLLVYKLAPADKEYTDLSGTFNTSSGGGYIIHSIEKVQNKSLWLQYEAKKKQLEGQNPAGTKNEQFLWHGTSEDTVDSVNAHGFNMSYCGKNATAFGNGVYFFVNANYSCQDTYSRPGTQGLKKMYYCAVLTGEFILGKSGMRVQPPKPNAGKNALYDSVVNNVAGPAMYIIFNDTQTYPLYIITFKKQ